MSGEIKILIVDDHPIFRKGLEYQLNEIPRVVVIGVCSNGLEFLNFIENKMPDIIFLDIKMPVMNGIEATQIAMKKYHDLKIIVLSMFGDEEYLTKMLDIGVKGFLLKNIEKEDLVDSINSALNDKIYLSPELISILNYIHHNNPKKVIANKQLNKKEKEVLKLICLGHTNIEIAKILFINPRMVSRYRDNLLYKTGCKNTVGIVTYAINNHLIEL